MSTMSEGESYYEIADVGPPESFDEFYDDEHWPIFQNNLAFVHEQIDVLISAMIDRDWQRAGVAMIRLEEGKQQLVGAMGRVAYNETDGDPEAMLRYLGANDARVEAMRPQLDAFRQVKEVVDLERTFRDSPDEPPAGGYI